jgi:hypothetical protein
MGQGLVLGWSVEDVQSKTTMISYTVVVPVGLLSVAANVTLNVPFDVGVNLILMQVTPRLEDGCTEARRSARNCNNLTLLGTCEGKPARIGGMFALPALKQISCYREKFTSLLPEGPL